MPPRSYLSYSQLVLFEKNPEEYRQIYFRDGKRFSNRYTEFGTRFHKAFETGETEDPVWQQALMCIPHYPMREHEMIALYPMRVKRKNLNVPLLAKMDGYDDKVSAIGDVKASKEWRQAMADSSDQLTFYSLVHHMKNGHLPKKLAIHWVETTEESGIISLTGFVRTFETQRTTRDLLHMGTRVARVWHGICEMGLQELGNVK